MFLLYWNFLKTLTDIAFFPFFSESNINFDSPNDLWKMTLMSCFLVNQIQCIQTKQSPYTQLVWVN